MNSFKNSWTLLIAKLYRGKVSTPFTASGHNRLKPVGVSAYVATTPKLYRAGFFKSVKFGKVSVKFW